MKVDIHCINCKVRIYVTKSNNLESPLDGGMFELPHQMEWPAPGRGVKGLDLVCPFCGYTFHDKDRMLYYGIVEMMPQEAKELFELSEDAELRQASKVPREIVSDDELALYMYKGERKKKVIMRPPEKISLSRDTRRKLRGNNA